MATWIQEHLQLIIVVGGAIAYWLNQRKLAQEGGEEPADNEKSFDDPALAERTRRIREDIQRKIEQRAGGHSPSLPPDLAPQPAELPPIFQEVFVDRPVRSPVTTSAYSAAETRRTAEILEQQATLAEQLKQANEMKALAQRRDLFQDTIADQSGRQLASRNTALSKDLRDPAALRRAFVLREVLGPPVALRS